MNTQLFSQTGLIIKGSIKWNKIDSINDKIYFLGDFTTNLFLNGNFLMYRNTLNGNGIPNDVRNNHEFCTFLVTQQSITDVVMSDDQHIFAQGQCLELKEACIDILTSAPLSII